MRIALVLAVLCSVSVGCDAGDGEATTDSDPPESSAVGDDQRDPSAQSSDSDSVVSTDSPPSAAELAAVGDELIEMSIADQEERADFGDPDLEPFDDETRTMRLAEIIDLYGWPTPDMVGEDANAAAFVLAQHSDARPDFQARVLGLIEAADAYPARDEQAALLTDRVAANANERQTFGSQVRCIDSEPVPYPEIEAPETVNDRRRGAGLEPLDIYLARFDEHCNSVALIPQEAGCGHVGGLGRIIEPAAVLLVGELHGTVDSPDFVERLVCSALSYGYDVTVALEIPNVELPAVNRYLASGGEEEARNDLLASPFWSTPNRDGRQSAAMLDLLDELRQHLADGEPVKVALLDGYDTTDRDATMAQNLFEAAGDGSDDRITISLTGNLHSRTVRGIDFDADYEPLGYLAVQALGADRVVSLDVAYAGGQAWTCTAEASCGPRDFAAPPLDASLTQTDPPVVTLNPGLGGSGHDGVYFVGTLTASLPAVNP